jgi:hypothetical protein
MLVKGGWEQVRVVDMDSQVREWVRVVGWLSEVEGGSRCRWWICMWTWVVVGWGGGEGMGGWVRAEVGGQ